MKAPWVRFVLRPALLAAPMPPRRWMPAWTSAPPRSGPSSSSSPSLPSPSVCGPQRFPRFVHWPAPTVDLHHIHHAVDRSQHDSNLGIPIFDLAFGTYTPPTSLPATSSASPTCPSR